MTRVKICGITRREDAEAAILAGADLLGFIFVPGTPRALEARRVEWVRKIKAVETVGVFRNAPVAEVLRVRDLLSLDWVQLHGGEPDSDLDELGGRVLRRVPTDGGVDWARVSWLAGRCMPLVDPGAGDGVAGEWSSWSVPEGLEFALAGGLSPTNVARAIAEVGPALVDVSSGVEAAPGIKDPARVNAFIAAVREAS